jgi:hypothetical protein
MDIMNFTACSSDTQDNYKLYGDVQVSQWNYWTWYEPAFPVVLLIESQKILIS